VKLTSAHWPLAAKSAAILLVVGAATGCGHSGSGHGNAGRHANSADAGSCLLGVNGANIEVGINHPTTSCAHWIQALAGSGLVWYPITQMVQPGSPGTADGENMAVACDLTDGHEELYIEDAGAQLDGDSICSQEEQHGWTPEGSPGPLALQGQQQAAAQAQAQASASAAASQASADQAAQQQAASDLQTLQGLSLSSDLSQMANALTQTSKALTAEKSAAAAGPNGVGGFCTNLESDVDAQAEDNVEANAVDNLGAEVQDALQPDIASGHQDIATLTSDLSNLQSLGLPSPSGAQAAIAAARSEIADAVSKANADISTENGYVDRAYSIANGIATGSCAGDGPGPVPQPIPRIG
jgi:hypothetical protein